MERALFSGITGQDGACAVKLLLAKGGRGPQHRSSPPQRGGALPLLVHLPSAWLIVTISMQRRM